MSDYELSAEITGNSQGFTNCINSCKNALSGFSTSFDKCTGSINKGLSEWGINLNKFYDKGSGIFKDFGLDIDKFAGKLGVSGPAIAAVTTATVALTKFGQEMHESMSEIAKGTGATGDALLELQESAKDAMIQGVGAPIKEIGIMIADLNTRFGVSGDTLVELTDKFDQFGNVTGVNTKEAINGVADVIEKWGMGIEDINPLLDQLTKAGQDSGASVLELTNNLKQNKTIFSQFGMSATKSIAFLESLAKAGIDTNTAMTGMRLALAKFTSEGKNAQVAFQEVGEAIKNANSDSEALNIAIETFGAKAGPEMINVFRSGVSSIEDFEKALLNAGGTLETTDEASRTSKDAMEDLINSLKGTFSGFGEGFDNLVKDILDSVRSLVEWIAPIIKPLGNIFRNVLTTIGSLIKILVNSFVEFQNKYNYIFQGVVIVSNNVYKTIHKILQNVTDVFGNSFGFIFAILDKNWPLAWEYAKNSLLKIADNILNIVSMLIRNLSTYVNVGIKTINKIIEGVNSVNKILGKNQISPMDYVDENFDLSESLGLDKLIEESNKKINELTGKSSQKLIGTLGEIKDVSTDIFSTVTSGAENVSNSVSQWSDKLEQQEIDRLEREKQNAVIRAENENKSENEIFNIKQSYDDRIKDLQEKRLEREKQNNLLNAKTAEEKAQIELYYNNEIAKLYEVNEEKIQKIKSKSSDWDEKLLSQKIAMLENAESLAVKNAEVEKKSEQDIFAIKQEYGQKIINLKKEQLENEEKIALENANDAEEQFKIKSYYENEISNMIKEENDKRLMILNEEKKQEENTWGDSFKTIVGIAGKTASSIVNAFKNVVGNIGKIFTSIKNISTKVFSGFKNVFKKLFEFDTTESLNSILEYEDKILTFFTFGIQKIPGFVDSVASSISILMDKLFNQIDLNQIADIIQKIIDSLVKYAPKIVSQLATIFTNLITTIANVIIQNADLITNAFGSIVMSVMDNLPTILKAFVSIILSLIKGLSDYINNNAEQFAQDLTNIIMSIVNALIEFLSNGGFKSLLLALVNIIKAINKAIVDNIPMIVDTIIDALPDIIDAIIEVIVDINKSASKIMKPIAKLVVQLVKGLITILTNEDVVNSALEAVIALLEAVMTEIIPELPKIVIQLVKGLINAFIHVNWINVVKEIFKAFINGIKSLFGIHSPSTLFQSFGSMMVQGLVNGLKNIWSNVSGIFSNLVSNIGNVFSNIGSTVSNAMSGLFDTVSGWVSSIGDKLGSIGSGISSIASKVGGAVSSGVSKVKSFFGFATGTPSAPSGLAVVGERGPELIDFKGGERVFNNNDSNRILAGGNNTSNSFNITFNNTSSTSAFDMIRQLKQYNRQLAFNGVL